jgi:PatG Domain
MQEDPETSTTSAHAEGSPPKMAAAANPGRATPAQAYDEPQPAQEVVASPQPNGGLGVTMPAFVYAIGRIEPRFPSLSAEKEFAQATGRAETAGLTDRQALHAVLSERQNRYLARQLCWVLTIEGLDTYILQPRDPGDLDLLIEALRPTPRLTDVDVVLGFRGPIAPPELCNGLMGPDRVLQPDLLLRCRHADQVDPATGEGHCQGLRRRGRGAVSPDHADSR